MDVPKGASINYKNMINDKNMKMNPSKKYYTNYNNKDNNSKNSNNRKEIYEKKNLISMNTDNNNLGSHNNNEYQSPKITYQNNLKYRNNNDNNKKMIKNNYSEINIYNKRNQNNKKNIQSQNENQNNFEINKHIIINYTAENKTNTNNSNYNSNYNTDNNTFQTISNSNSNNSNMVENTNKVGISLKYNKDISNNINKNNNFTSYKKEDYTEINNKKDLKKSYQIKNDNKNKDKDKQDNRSSSNNHYYYQSNTEQQLKRPIYNKNINSNNIDRNDNSYINLNRMINSVNIDISKDKINNRLKKNISNFSENFEHKNSFKIKKNEIENNNQKTKQLNKKDIIIESKNINKVILRKNNSKITKDKISPNKNQNNNNINKVNTNTFGNLTNYKEKPNHLIKNKEIVVTSKFNNDKKNKGNNEDKNEVFNIKNLSVNINDKDINGTPNNKNINLINLGNTSSSYSKKISGSTSKNKNNNGRIANIKNSDYKNENDYMNKNKGRILMNTNKISKFNQISTKTEENNLPKINKLDNQQNKNTVFENNNNNKIIYFYNKDEWKKDFPLFISPDKYNREEKKELYNSNCRILSSAKIRSREKNKYIKNTQENYFPQEKKILKNETSSVFNNQEWNNINFSYPYKTSIFKNNSSNKNNYVDYKNEDFSDDLKTFKIRINKNITNYQRKNKNDEYEKENEIEQFNISERIIEKEKKKIGSDSRTKIIKKSNLKNSYSPNLNTNYNINKEANDNFIENEVISYKTEFLNKNKKNNNLINKSQNYPINNTNNYINNNIILNKNTNLYVMNNNTDNLEKSIDSLQKKEMTYQSLYNNKNTIYKKRNTNESKIIINNFNPNNINKNQFINSPTIRNNFTNNNSNNILNSNIYDFDTPAQNFSKKNINKTTINDNINNSNYQNNNNININTNNLLSERNIKVNNNRDNEHSNNFINLKIRNNLGSPKIYKKKFDSKNRPFILQKENKINNYKESNYSTDEYNIEYNKRDIISFNQNKFKKEIQNIYNEQENNFNEFNDINSYEINWSKKYNIIKPPLVIDENINNKKVYENYIENKNNDKNIPQFNSKINKKRLRLNKEKIHFEFNEKKNKKDIILFKPTNKNSFKYKYYYYNIKNCVIKECFYSKSYISKNPINKITDNNNSFKINKKVNIISIENNTISNDNNNEITFTEKIPVQIDNNINFINNDEIFINENSFKESKFKNNNQNELTSHFKISNENKSNINNKNNNFSNTFSKIKENIKRMSKLNNIKTADKDELEMTFGIEDINNNNQSKNIINNQIDINSNINDFSTINNNTNHSIVINEYINGNPSDNNNNENINNKLNINENKNKEEEDVDKINDYLDDEEEENQNDDFQVISEEEEIKKEEEKNINIDNKINNSIKKRIDTKIVQITEGKEIKGEQIPDKINKGLKLLELFQVKRNSKNEFNTDKKTLSNSDNNNIITYNNNFEEDELLINNEKKNNIFKTEFFYNEDIYKKKTNTFKPKKTERIIENMTKNKKCKLLNDILTDIFDKKGKEKENNLYFYDYNIRSKTPLSHRNKINDEENEETNEQIEENDTNKEINSKKNTYNPKKIEKYAKIFNLNTIKNLEDILNKKRVNRISDIINDNTLNDEYISNRQSVLTYNKKLKNIDSDEDLFEKDYISNSNKYLEINTFNKNLNYNNKDEKKEKTNKNKSSNNIASISDTPKFKNAQIMRINQINNQYLLSYEEIINFNKVNSLCLKENLLSEEVISHCNKLLNYSDIEYIKANLPTSLSNEKWNRKDLTKEIKAAEEYIKKMNIEMKKDNFKFEIIEILNTITVDNYEDILNKLSMFIYEIDNKNYKNIRIKPEILLDNQYRFAEIIIDKAIMEKGYVKLYAMLCRDLYLILNKIIDNYFDVNIKNQLYNSENLKSLLIGECKQRFNDYQYNNKEENDYDIIFLIKKKFLGNINFIVELINVKLFSQKIGFDFLDILYRNYKEKEIGDKNKYLNLEGIITLLNKFGYIISERKNEKFVQNLNNYMSDYIIPIKEKKDNDLPSHLKYKIINLIEKQKNNWEESLYEKSIIVKGKNNNLILSNSFKEDNNHSYINNKNEIKNNNNDNDIINKSKDENLLYKNYNICKSEIIKLKRIKFEERKKNNSMEISFNLKYLNILNNPINNKEKENSKDKLKNKDEEKIINLLKNDFNDFILFLEDIQSNKLNNDLDEEYNWKVIDDLLLEKKIGLNDLIRYIIEVFIDLISKDNAFYGNEYIYNIIYYYSNILEKNEKNNFHNKMNELISNIDNIILENNNMFEILGNLLYFLLDIKLFFIKDLNNFQNSEKQTLINISIVIKYIILASDKNKKQFYNDFKELKIFLNNDLFDKYIKIPLKEDYEYQID